MMKIFFLISLLGTGIFAKAFAEVPESAELSIRAPDYKIDWKYNAGEYLIYDCERKHFACVNATGNDNCVEERRYALVTKAAVYPCAPLKKFKNKKECVENNYKIVELDAPKRFCYPK
ncbi:MAG: hypothetical protein Q7U04_04775 [Bacteriovorax sp.]|nr:hypothetical protein [Bacteriovorax sp.]